MADLSTLGAPSGGLANTDAFLIGRPGSPMVPYAVTASALRTYVLNGLTISAGSVTGLATVATSGAYADLSGKPALAAVATSGSASDLTTGTLPAARLPATAVTPGTYGDASHVAAITVGADGRITGVTTAAISAGGGGSTVTTMAGTDLVQIKQGAAYAMIAASDMLTSLGETISQGSAAAQLSDSDQLWINQGGQSDVVASMAAVWTYTAAKLPGYKPATLNITANVVLDPTTHNNGTLVVTASGVTVSLSGGSGNPTQNIGDGFRCTIINASGSTVSFDAAIITSTGSSTLAANGVAHIYGTTAGGLNSVFADLGGGSSVPSITFGAYSPSPAAALSGNTSVSVTISGVLHNYSSVPTLNYSTDGTSYSALPAGNSVSSSAFSFALTLSAGAHTIYVKDTAAGGPVANQSVPVEGASLASVPTTGTQGQAITGATATLTQITTAYAVLYTSSADEGTRQSFAGTSVPSLTPQNSGAYTLRIYDAATAGNLLAESASITVAAASPTLSLATVPTQYTDETTMPVSGTYAYGTPTSITYAFTTAGTSGTVGSLTISGGNWSGTIPLPATGTDTLTVTGTGSNTASASQSVTTAAATITPTAPTGLTAGATFTLAGTYQGSTALTAIDYSWDGGTTWSTNHTATVNGSNWSIGATAPAQGTYTLTVRRTNHTSITGSASSISVGAASSLAVSSVTPQAIGVVGQPVNFTVAYTGTFGTLAVTLDGTALTSAQFTATDNGSGSATVTITGPAVTAGDPASATTNVYGLHTIAVAPSGGGTSKSTLFACQPTAGLPANLYTAGVYPTSGAHPVTLTAGAYMYLGTATSQGPTGNGTWYQSSGGNNPPSGWTEYTATGGTSVGSLALIGLSQSQIVPPGTLPAATTSTSGRYLQEDNRNGTTKAWTTSISAWAAGTYYVWFMTADGYCYVYPTPITVS